MNKFKIGDAVRCIGTRAGNQMFGTGVISTNINSSNNYGVRPDDGGPAWNVRNVDLVLVNKEAEVAFAMRFLNAEGKKLFKDEYLEVSINASSKMKTEMELVAVESFLESYKKTNK